MTLSDAKLTKAPTHEVILVGSSTRVSKMEKRL